MITQLLAWTRRLAAWRSPTGTQRRVALIVALTAFAAMGFLALRSLPADTTDTIDWDLLLVIGVAGPTVTIALNAAEFRAQGRLLNHAIGRLDALRISTLSTAANLLPLPGSVVVRTGSLVRRGSSLRDATATGVVAGVAWIGTAFTTAALGGFLLSEPLLGVVGLAVGAALIAVSHQLAGRLRSSTANAWRELLLIEFALTAVSGARIYGAVTALGFEVSGGQALALTVSGAIASAAGIFPSGIGLREGIAAGVATLVDLPAAVGFVAAALDRIVGLVVLAVATLIFLRRPEAEPTGDLTSVLPD